MVRRLGLVSLLLVTLVSGFGCRLCDRGRLFNRDWSSRERDRDRPRDDGTGGFLREPAGGGRMIPSPDVPSGAMDLPPVPETRFRSVPDDLRPGRELLLPEGETPKTAAPKSGSLLGTPEAIERDRESRKAPTTTDLDGYTRVKNTIASGRVPTASGMDKLKAAGFKAIAYLHEPSANLDAIRKDADAAGLKFVSVPFSASSVADGAKAFAEAVADRGTKPTYVCDDDGSRAGAAWYLHFRTVDFANEDTAQLLAAPLGWSDSTTGDRGAMVTAIRQYLAGRP